MPEVLEDLHLGRFCHFFSIKELLASRTVKLARNVKVVVVGRWKAQLIFRESSLSLIGRELDRPLFSLTS